jgi:threonine synthase
MAGIRARIYVPAHASGGKLAQIVQYGATLVRVPGSREDTTTACLAAAEKTFYASHNWSPYFQAGMKTAAFEIAEQLDWNAPDWVVTPVGGGSLLLGLYHGFREMHEAGMVGHVPRIAGVQSVHCPPVYQAWQKNLDDVLGVVKGDTIAEGISVAKPVKGRDILQALRACDGVVLTVDDDAVWAAVEALGRVGVSVEPTGAVSAAGVEPLAREGLTSPGQRVVVVLTGSGLKAADKIMEHYAKS